VNSRLLLANALRNADRDMAVFPLWPHSKVPALHGANQCTRSGVCANGHRGWEEQATRDPVVIGRWWRRWPLNIGIAAGRSDLHVIDLDTGRGAEPPPRWAGARHGGEVLARLADQTGEPFPGDTFTVRTPSGGFHLYFRVPPALELRNTTGRLGWRVDSRGSGGYVVAAGSLRRDGRYAVTKDIPIAPLPSWLVPLLRPPLAPPDPLTGWHRDQPVSQSRKIAYLRRIHDSVAGTPRGRRHHVLVRAAFTLGRLVAGGDLTVEDARDCLYDAAAYWRGAPSIKDTNTIEDGLRAGALQPRQLAG
jgi:Bifunctional DNA primase/polymerase, N-terminal